MNRIIVWAVFVVGVTVACIAITPGKPQIDGGVNCHYLDSLAGRSIQCDPK